MHRSNYRNKRKDRKSTQLQNTPERTARIPSATIEQSYKILPMEPRHQAWAKSMSCESIDIIWTRGTRTRATRAGVEKGIFTETWGVVSAFQRQPVLSSLLFVQLLYHVLDSLFCNHSLEICLFQVIFVVPVLSTSAQVMVVFAEDFKVYVFSLLIKRMLTDSNTSTKIWWCANLVMLFGIFSTPRGFGRSFRKTNCLVVPRVGPLL